MPSCRRKRVVLIEPSPSLLQAAKTNPNKKVFFLEQTGEIFEGYEAYAARMSFYRLKQFQCEVTGKSGLDYFQALESERQEARTLHARFPEPLKPVILKAVQWQVMSRLDHLVEAVYERYKDRYFKGEKVVVDLSGTKYHAIVDRVYPPKYHHDSKARDQYLQEQEKDEVVHAIDGDLKIPIKDVVARDDPHMYYYWVQILEPEKDRNDKAKGGTTKQPETKDDTTVVGSLMEVQCIRMSRDRLAFSKSILRRFIRDCVDRDAAVASPWTVKPEIAKRYGVQSEMPEETRKGVESMKKGESDKRKKAWEDKEAPPNKKQKKMAAQEEKSWFLVQFSTHLLIKRFTILAKAAVAAAEKRDREEQERLEKEEVERLAAEKKKKKPVRYPTEDLDVRIGDKEKKAGMKVKRPVASRVALPFNDTPGTFEQFLLAWNFLVVYGQPLHLSPFTLDEFEHAIRHALPDLPCNLLAEVHSTLIYNLRTVPFHRHSAILSLLRERDQTTLDGGEDARVLGITIDELTGAMADVGNNWERVPLRSSEGREGWEEALIGCLKDHATTQNFPRLREILIKLLFAPEGPSDQGSPSSSSSTLTPETPNPGSYTILSTPAERYPALPPQDRLAILSFMCNLAVSSKAIHAHMESCEEQLTALRKEKIEVNRVKKQYLEEMNNLQGEMKEDPNVQNGDEDVMMQDSPDLSASESGTETSKKGTSRQKDLQKKAQLQAHAKQREAARAKQASVKQAMAEHRRLDEECNKLERRLEGIERDFRKLLGGVRVKPLGKDRFHNRIWWFDGMGSGTLVGSGGVAQYGTGRIFIQGPSEFDLEILQQREEDIEARRQEEEGVEGMLGPGDWAVYSDIEELDEFVAWLNPKGHRELALKTALGKWWIHITAGIRRRLADVNANTKQPEARRSTRTKANYDVSREPYMTWTNRRAINAS
ncbi:ddt domain protein [Moniliophthora roreri MCA 2997]|uniref:Ddt domain protein n=1 Tax=Moniliophthora roreri (strain MCA 2997) TaxID=1381753 RepID=V2XX73_MONRO|nr:ddt domain protein [Moniliophthora roreri MCA 2997]